MTEIREKNEREKIKKCCCKRDDWEHHPDEAHDLNEKKKNAKKVEKKTKQAKSTSNKESKQKKEKNKEKIFDKE